MKEKLMSWDVKDRFKHMCTLKSQGLDDCIKSLSDNPRVKCKYCGAKANSIRNVCATQLGTRRPLGKAISAT